MLYMCMYFKFSVYLFSKKVGIVEMAVGETHLLGQTGEILHLVTDLLGIRPLETERIGTRPLGMDGKTLGDITIDGGTHLQPPTDPGEAGKSRDSIVLYSDEPRVLKIFLRDQTQTSMLNSRSWLKNAQNFENRKYPGSSFANKQ